MKRIIKIEGMHCASCAQTIEKALKKTKGIVNANVNFATEKATVDYDSNNLDEEKIKEVIKSTGYKPEDIQREVTEKDTKINLEDILEKGMKSEVNWEFKGKLGKDIIMIKKPSKRFLEIIYRDLNIDILKRAIKDLGYYAYENNIKEMANIGCAKCQLFKECKPTYTVYKSGINSLFGSPIIKFFDKLIQIYKLEPSLEILERYEERLKESKDEVRHMMLYGSSS